MRASAVLFDQVHIGLTDRADGDQRPQRWQLHNPTVDAPALADPGVAQLLVTGEVWTFVHQVHHRSVLLTRGPAGPIEAEADGLVTDLANLPLSMLGADCALIGFGSPEGVIGVAHAGWRGLLEGVIEATITQMRDLGARTIAAAIGPTIGVECYEFSPDDLVPLIERFGPAVEGRTTSGSVALDLRACIDVALGEAMVSEVTTIGACTACDPMFYSWRARHDSGRQALVIWREDDLAHED